MIPVQYLYPPWEMEGKLAPVGRGAIPKTHYQFLPRVHASSYHLLIEPDPGLLHRPHLSHVALPGGLCPYPFSLLPLGLGQEDHASFHIMPTVLIAYPGGIQSCRPLPAFSGGPP